MNLYLNRSVKRQNGNTYSRTRVPARVAEDFSQHLGCAVGNNGLIGEIRSRRNKDGHMDHSLDRIDVAHQIGRCSQSVEGSNPSQPLGVFERNVCTHLSLRRKFPIDEGQLARCADEAINARGWNV